jgi:Fe2+ transport system protein B
MLEAALKDERIALIGLESAGKTTLFSRLCKYKSGEETNVKGSSYSIRTRHIENMFIVDTPGIRMSEYESNEIALKEINQSDKMILVARGTHFQDEIKALLSLVRDTNKPFIIVITYADKMSASGKQKVRELLLREKLPLFLIDTRKLTDELRTGLTDFVTSQKVWPENQMNHIAELNLEKVEPSPLAFDSPVIGPLLSICTLISMFLFPVWIAYQFSSIVQPVFDNYLLDDILRLFENFPPLIQTVMIGDYGLLTLGIYSFIWAFPVVFLMGVSTAVADETGIKDRMIDSLAPAAKRIGMDSQDLVPVLTGFGCNVVAVYQSRNCSACSRKHCVSMISIGSACSYQIGATLSIFNSAQSPWLFFPYILMLAITGIIHKRFWYNSKAYAVPGPLPRKTFLQKPTWLGIWFRIKSDIKQFCTQAMPIFAFICFISAFLQAANIIQAISVLFLPMLSFLQLPVEAASGLAFSMIRKDGILLFHQGQGDFLAGLSDPQLFLLVFLSSTLTACLVTMTAMAKEFGLKTAFQFIYRQVITSVGFSICILLVLKFFKNL